MDVPVGWLIAAGVLAVAAVAAIITLTVLLSVSRGQLTSTRRDLADLRERQGKRRRKLGVAPLAVRTVWQTADSLLNKGIVSTVRNSIEDLAGWAQVERPDLARLTANGDVTIAFSDIEGSTQLNEALGDREWVKILERHNKLVGRCVDDHGGHIVKSQGDGFMMAFGDPREALECAEEIQADLGSDRVLASGEHPIRVRMGIHHGRSVRRGDDEWFAVVKWVINALIEAEELGITQAKADSMKSSPDPTVQRFLGVGEDLGKSLGLDREWAARAVKAGGNYGDIFNRNVGADSPLKLPRGLNAQWNKGGILYALPLR